MSYILAHLQFNPSCKVPGNLRQNDVPPNLRSGCVRKQSFSLFNCSRLSFSFLCAIQSELQFLGLLHSVSSLSYYSAGVLASMLAVLVLISTDWLPWEAVEWGSPFAWGRPWRIRS
jgi:hypothetical protein